MLCVEVWPWTEFCLSMSIGTIPGRSGTALRMLFVEPAHLGLYQSLCILLASLSGWLSRTMLLLSVCPVTQLDAASPHYKYRTYNIQSNMCCYAEYCTVSDAYRHSQHMLSSHGGSYPPNDITNHCTCKDKGHYPPREILGDESFPTCCNTPLVCPQIDY